MALVLVLVLALAPVPVLGNPRRHHRRTTQRRGTRASPQPYSDSCRFLRLFVWGEGGANLT
jgi:hypothetical protein